MLVPVSGGGLISGIAAAITALPPDAKVIGVEPELAGDAAESFRAGRRIPWTPAQTARTMADGLRTFSVGELPWEHISTQVHDIITVTEDEIADATRRLLLQARLVAEPSGAVAAAALPVPPRPAAAAARRSPWCPAATSTRPCSGRCWPTLGTMNGLRPGTLITLGPGRRRRSATCCGAAIDAEQVGASRIHLAADQPDFVAVVAGLRRQTGLVITTDPDHPGRRPGRPAAAGLHRDRAGRRTVADRPGRPGGPDRRRTAPGTSASAAAARPPFRCCSPRWRSGAHVLVGTALTRRTPPPDGPARRSAAAGRDDAALVARASGLARIAGRPRPRRDGPLGAPARWLILSRRPVTDLPVDPSAYRPGHGSEASLPHRPRADDRRCARIPAVRRLRCRGRHQDPDAGGCWCMAYRDSRVANPDRPGYMRTECETEPGPGVLVYVDDVVAGWCSIAPRGSYRRLLDSRTIPILDDADAWVAVCFVVRAGFRKHGLMHPLLTRGGRACSAHGAAGRRGLPGGDRRWPGGRDLRIRRDRRAVRAGRIRTRGTDDRSQRWTVRAG